MQATRIRAKRQRARALHQIQKRRARYKRVIAFHANAHLVQTGRHSVYKYKTEFSESLKEHLAQFGHTPMSAFSHMLKELSQLHNKILQQLLSDLNENGAIPPFYGEYHRMLVNSIENTIMERTMLK